MPIIKTELTWEKIDQMGINIRPHISKRSSDLEQNGTQEKTPFSSTVFHAVWSVLLRVLAQQNISWLVGILWQPIRSFYSLHSYTAFEANTRNKTEHTMWKGMEKLCQKMVSFLVYYFVWGYLGVWRDVAHKKLRSKLGPKQPGPPEARDPEPHQISKRAYFEE